MDKIIIEPRSNFLKLDLREVYQYRELLWTLTYRDFRAKYAQTALGFIWALINPILTLLILSFVFGTVAKVETGEIPHLLYTLAGMCGWQYFSAVVGQAGASVVGAQSMIKKIYFPRLIIPLSKSITALIDLGVVLIILTLLMIYYKFQPSSSVIYLPFFILIALIAGLATGILMSALTTKYRDFQQIIPVLLRVGLYITPVAYPASAVPEKYKMVYFLNPMAGVVEGVRWSIIGGTPPGDYMYISFVVIIFIFILSLFYFKKVERVMPDIL